MHYLKKIIILNVIIVLMINKVFSVSSDFLGQWCSDKNNNESTFSITIKKGSNFYFGAYDSVILNGNKIDDNERAFSFKETNRNYIKTKIKAGITNNIGLIKLELLSSGKVKWLVLQMPEGEFYVPREAILHKC